MFTQVATVHVNSVPSLDSGVPWGSLMAVVSPHGVMSWSHSGLPPSLTSCHKCVPTHLETSHQSCQMCLKQRCFSYWWKGVKFRAQTCLPSLEISSCSWLMTTPQEAERAIQVSLSRGLSAHLCGHVPFLPKACPLGPVTHLPLSLPLSWGAPVTGLTARRGLPCLPPSQLTPATRPSVYSYLHRQKCHHWEDKRYL